MRIFGLVSPDMLAEIYATINEKTMWDCAGGVRRADGCGRIRAGRGLCGRERA